MTTQSVNPHTGEVFGPEFSDCSSASLDEVLGESRDAFECWSRWPDKDRSEALELCATGLDDHVDELAVLADSETGLGVDRLRREVARSSFQLRMFADLVSSGAHRGMVDDPAVPGPPPHGHPNLLRKLLPLGPVAIFGASNFPFAFGVCGGDTASALAAGCSVVVKAHPSHPQTSEATARVLQAALRDARAPNGTLSLVHGFEVGRLLVMDPRIAAGAFTGSRAAGRALFDLAVGRDVPIPFYGELGSVNPVIATVGGLTDPVAFSSDYLDSLTLGSGQFCTNPGLLLVPSGLGVTELLALGVRERETGPLLSAGVLSLLEQALSHIQSLDGAYVVGSGRSSAEGFGFAPTIVSVPMRTALLEPLSLTEECFGPVGIVIEYDDIVQVQELINLLPGFLVSAIHAREGEPIGEVLRALITRSGRIVWNGWPTGVAVTLGQHHGGPYPVTTSPLHTSVGTHAIDRFLRPVAFQDFPSAVMPG